MLITPEYKAGNRLVHERQPMWGSSAGRWQPDVLAMCRSLGAKSVLDYGCGKGLLRLAVGKYGYDMREYDPGIPGKDGSPGPADIVACLDVLEHVEPECLQDVLAHIGDLAQKGAFLAIALYPSATIMPDGRNSHLIVEAPEWWLAQLAHAWHFPMTMDSDVRPRPSRNPRNKDVLAVRMIKQ